jgi:membrane complex biogenesis BtpA family protein
VSLPSLIGMVHLLPLPGSPGYDGDMAAVVNSAVADAQALEEAGFPAVMIENFGDAPFFADRVPPETVAAITVAVVAVGMATGLAVGVNVLRNDALSALGIAAATGAQFIRVNVLTGTMFTDQGPVVGRAAEVARRRRQLCPQAAILADVFVKHATPPPGATIERAAADTIERGGADALIVSGPGTGTAVDSESGRLLRRHLPHAHLLVGSGATPETIPQLAAFADGAIVGSWLKQDGIVTNRVDGTRAAAIAAAARQTGWI